jgi:NAD(P)-dependent dehydrogenase (short-subunit alcohol dehydrogenase family)
VQLSGGTAVVTGAASGIGRALAGRFAGRRLNVVMADVEETALTTAGRELSEQGASVLTVPTDVSSFSSVESLADAAESRFGPVHVLCNNAGVAGGGSPIWNTSDNDWEWVLGVNLMGVVHGVRAFVPRMLDHGQDGHVVNTSSVLGLSTGGGSIYSVTKHAVTRLTEGLWHDLRAAGARISASVLCPGMVATHIISAERNRPVRLRDVPAPGPTSGAAPDAAREAGRQTMQARFLADGMPPEEVADMVVDAIEQDRFYVLTHPDLIKPQVQRRLQAIIDESDPPAPAPLAARAATRGGTT